MICYRGFSTGLSVILGIDPDPIWIERILPDILIEDDCESIGGDAEMIYPHLKAEMRGGIISLVVKEFEGIDHLPDNLAMLTNKRTS